MDIRTRYAPSPTGFLHIGGVRTALFCYAWAKKNGGTFLLRIEDTDQERFVSGAVQQIIDSLTWVGLLPDEGVVASNNDQIEEKGPRGPYVQSQRIDLYNKFAQQLISEKKAYKCWCSSERLDAMRAAQRAAKQMPKYDRHCYHLDDARRQELEQSEEPYVIRFFVPEKTNVAWNDIVFGEMKFEQDQLDDFVILKSDRFPTYNFANVIDDHSMEISHVIRAQEFLSSTPKHLLLYEAFGWNPPVIVHVPWVLGTNKQKLSKRHGDVAVDEYRKKGILPQALINYLALLGWNPKDGSEIMSLSEIVEKFDLQDIQKSGAVFDYEKLLWMNATYIRQMSGEELLEAALPFLGDYVRRESDETFQNLLSGKTLSRNQLISMLALEQERIKALHEIGEKMAFLLKSKLEYEPAVLVWKKGTVSDVQMILPLVKAELEHLSDWSAVSIREALQRVVQSSAKGVGDIFWPARVALSGQQSSPSPEEIAEIIGKEESIARINAAIDMAASL